MLRNGDVVTLPGMRAVMTVAPADRSVDRMEMEITLDPGAVGAPPHRHPSIDEEYRVLSGTLSVLSGRRWEDIPAGGSVVIPAGRNHTFRNTSAEAVVLTNIHRPAGAFADYWERLGALSSAGRITSLGDPRTIMTMSMLVMDHPAALRPTGALAVVMPIAAWIGRRLGVNRDLTPSVA